MKCYLTVLISLLITFSCSKNEDGIGNAVNTEINFYPIQVFSDINTLPSLKLRLETTETYPCSNFGIKTTQSIEGEVLNISIIDIFQTELCLTAGGPATSYIDLSENIRQVRFIKGKSSDLYDVSINNEKVEIEAIEYSFTNLFDRVLFKYPENTFAYICGTNFDNDYIFNSFLKILSDSLLLEEYQFAGEGVIPYATNSSGAWKNNPSVFFKYVQESDVELVGEMLRKFTDENISSNDGVSITLTNWKNKNYHSWDQY